MSKTSHLVIGSNSFLGRQLCKQLFKQNRNVTGVFHKNTQNLYSKVNHLAFEELFILEDNYAYIYVVSSYIPHKNDTNVAALLETVNIKLVQKICHHFTNAKIIFCSSVSVYGNTVEYIDEQSKLQPLTIYAKSKLIGENIVSKHSKYAIVRISSLFGKRMKSITFLPLIIQSAIKNNSITLFGSGERLQNYIHVKRAAHILIKAALHDSNAVFLAVHKKSYTNKEIAMFVGDSFQNLTIKFTGKDDSISYIYNNSYTEKVLQLKKQKSIKDEIKTLVTWMRKEY
jgi:nucleoside-diphosphate-sugar epimerase